jgi:hypothetical protein
MARTKNCTRVSPTSPSRSLAGIPQLDPEYNRLRPRPDHYMSPRVSEETLGAGLRFAGLRLPPSPGAGPLSVSRNEGHVVDTDTTRGEATHRQLAKELLELGSTGDCSAVEDGDAALVRKSGPRGN